ncbi:MAG TPA: L-histidine N(alpha)-methyltransferase [Nitrosopumilaceae archaeon]|nr:L-histidine N(alpha)-methyltransferase [Nitrosopumilaceae archaeon]
MNSKTIQQILGYEKHVIDSKTSYFRPKNGKTQSFVDEISSSLRQDKKSLHPKFFYDKKGSQLFEKICSLPEYYLTRTEIKILQKIELDLVRDLENDVRLVEFGSGSSKKTRLILDKLSLMQDRIEYVPIDISDIIKESSQELHHLYSNLQITGIIDTYENGLEFISHYDDKQNLIVFLGSSFGNFEQDEGILFLKKVNSVMKDNDLFLIGLDLVKEKSILENAYDDPQGITAQFNLNVLERINGELEADFDLKNFVHLALYNEEKQRIEMYLRSTKEQTVQIKKANLFLQLEKDELIHTENSHKYTILQIQNMFEKTGFKIKQIWQDNKNHYAMVLASKKY